MMIWKHWKEAPPPPPPPPKQKKTHRKHLLQQGLGSSSLSSTNSSSSNEHQDNHHHHHRVLSLHDSWSTFYTKDDGIIQQELGEEMPQYQDTMMVLPKDASSTLFSHTATFHSLLEDTQPNQNKDEPSLLVQQLPSNYTTSTPSFLKASQERPPPARGAMMIKMDSSSLADDTTTLFDTSTFHTAADHTFSTAPHPQLQASSSSSQQQQSQLSSEEKAHKLAQLYLVGSTEQQEQYLQFCDQSEIAMAIQLLEQMSATNNKRSSKKEEPDGAKRATVEPVSHERGLTLVANVSMDSPTSGNDNSKTSKNNANNDNAPTTSGGRPWKKQQHQFARDNAMVNASSSSLSTSITGGMDRQPPVSSVKDHLPQSFATLFACAENTTDKPSCNATAVMAAAQRLPFADQTATCCNKVQDASVETWKTQSVRAQQWSRKLQLQMQNLRASHDYHHSSCHDFGNNKTSSVVVDTTNFPKPSAVALTRQPTPAQPVHPPKRVVPTGAYGSFEDGGTSNGYTTFEV